MQTIQKFQDLLKRLFQFEASDLDFGIYRILNYKRERVEKFIQEDLKNKVETAFAKHKDERLTDINRRFEEAKEYEEGDFVPHYRYSVKGHKYAIERSYLFTTDKSK